MTFFNPFNTSLGVIKLHIVRRKKLDTLGDARQVVASEDNHKLLSHTFLHFFTLHGWVFMNLLMSCYLLYLVCVGVVVC
jgi:hypothetical protein